MDPEQLRQIFYGECDDYLGSANEQLGLLEEEGDHREPLNALFRAVHSIKGGARAFGIDQLAEFAHAFESFMDKLRKGDFALGEENYGRLTLGFDMLAQLVGESRGETAGNFDYDGFVRDLQGLLDGVAPKPVSPGGAPPPSTTPPPTEPDASQPEAMYADAASFHRYQLSVVPAAHMFTSGADPLLLIRNLGQIGAVTASIDTSRLPPLPELDVDIPYFRWTLEIESEASHSDIQDILDFIDDVAAVALTDLDAPAAPSPPPPTSLTSPTSLARTENAGGSPPASADDQTRGDAMIPVPASTAKPSGASPAKDDRRVPTVRVDVPKLERLGNMVGELVIAQAVLQRQAADIPETERPGLFRAIKDMSQYIRDLQDIAMAVRAQPLKVAFSRLAPVTRELERATGKKIKLAMTGEDTEIDKTVVDRLAEPLTHLLRNAADHGLETREQRTASGKPIEGTITLSAEQRGSQVFITIEDDGKGINRQAVRDKALSRGLIEANAELSDGEIDNLIFLPGFSTAEQVTEVSGRGVGMDVVRQTITDLGGQIVVESAPGVGCRFTMVLPLSLAIIDVLVAEIGRQRYLLPIGSVIESVRPLDNQIVTVPGRGRFLHLRGQMLPILSLAEEFAIPGAVIDPTRAILVIVELRRGQSGALLVDDVLGQEPVVVKSLERNYHKVPGVAAATILGDGKAALIVDFSGLRGLVYGPARGSARGMEASLR